MWEFLKQLTDPQSIIEYGGLALLLLVVFAETGLFIGFFLPGDSLMFISGMICATRPDLLNVNIAVLIVSLISAAVIGNIVGYWFGRKVGPALFRRDDSLIFKKRYVEITDSFYRRHGGKTLILGRFLPIIRTFAPILAGVIGVNFGAFMIYNVVGATAWVTSLALAGYWLGQFEFVQNYIEYIVIALIIVTMIPVVRTYRRERRLHKEK
ncbi:MAG: VTT domain-containing protein [Bacteroidota bacterium]